MKESILKERLDLIERECAIISDKLDDLDRVKKGTEDLQIEIKGLKLFLSRVYPEFKKQFPEIIKKLRG